MSWNPQPWAGARQDGLQSVPVLVRVRVLSGVASWRGQCPLSWSSSVPVPPSGPADKQCLSAWNGCCFTLTPQISDRSLPLNQPKQRCTVWKGILGIIVQPSQSASLQNLHSAPLGTHIHLLKPDTLQMKTLKQSCFHLTWCNYPMYNWIRAKREDTMPFFCPWMTFVFLIFDIL